MEGYIEAILARRETKEEAEYLIKWCSSDEAVDVSWERRSHLEEDGFGEVLREADLVLDKMSSEARARVVRDAVDASQGTLAAKGSGKSGSSDYSVLGESMRAVGSGLALQSVVVQSAILFWEGNGWLGRQVTFGWVRFFLMLLTPMVGVAYAVGREQGRRLWGLCSASAVGGTLAWAAPNPTLQTAGLCIVIIDALHVILRALLHPSSLPTFAIAIARAILASIALSDTLPHLTPTAQTAIDILLTATAIRVATALIALFLVPEHALVQRKHIAKVPIFHEPIHPKSIAFSAASLAALLLLLIPNFASKPILPTM